MTMRAVYKNIHNAQSCCERLNFIPLWEWTWCHCIFYVGQDWKAHAVVRSQENMRMTTKRRSWKTLVETHYDVTLILKVGWSLASYKYLVMKSEPTITLLVRILVRMDYWVLTEILALVESKYKSIVWTWCGIIYLEVNCATVFTTS